MRKREMDREIKREKKWKERRKRKKKERERDRERERERDLGPQQNKMGVYINIGDRKGKRIETESRERD
jgi:hypothetical protein